MQRIKNLSSIEINTAEGRLLMAALAKITTESQTDKTPDEVIAQCIELAEHMFKDATPLPDEKEYVRPEFFPELTSLINSYSKENDSNTPDFILCKYIENSLSAFTTAIRTRDNWYGGAQSPGNVFEKKLWTISFPKQ